MTYQDLQSALKLLGLGERASLAEIKTRYRQLVKKHHPDGRLDPGDPAMIRQLNAAYALIRGYCEDYCYCFSLEEFLEQNPEERLRRQFANDPLWADSPPRPD